MKKFQIKSFNQDKKFIVCVIKKSYKQKIYKYKINLLFFKFIFSRKI